MFMPLCNTNGAERTDKSLFPLTERVISVPSRDMGRTRQRIQPILTEPNANDMSREGSCNARRKIWHTPEY
jgi:hypothetical protein